MSIRSNWFIVLLKSAISSHFLWVHFKDIFLIVTVGIIVNIRNV